MLKPDIFHNRYPFCQNLSFTGYRSSVLKLFKRQMTSVIYSQTLCLHTYSRN